MKIALSGSSGTGKTTLTEAIGKDFSIPIIPEFARDVAKEMDIKELRELSPEKTYEFQNKILDRKIEEELKHHTFIADRSTADNIAYYLRWCCREIDDELNKTYISRCTEQLKTYDKIYILPWNAIPLKDDGFRSSKIYYQYEIHCLILGILEMNNIEYDVIEMNNFAHRLEFFGRGFKFFEQGFKNG